ncbi:MAG: IS110 family transposase [bacterium]
MSKDTLHGTTQPEITVGFDIGDRFSQLCLLDAAGEVTEESRIATTLPALMRKFGHLPRARVVLESTTHSPWIARTLTALGHEVIVSNARRVQLIAQNNTKTDQVDAELLARLGRADPRLLHPVQHRGLEAQADLAGLRARDALVRARTLLVNHVRGSVKAMGGRIPRCATESFVKHATPAVPPRLGPALTPVLTEVAQLTTQIRQCDRAIAQRVATRYPEARALMQLAGVGALTALCFVLVLEDPARFPTSRAVGSYVGLRPKKRASAGMDPECHITKAGDGLLRRLLVGSAQYVLGPFGPDTDLRRWGLGLAARGRKNAKKRAVVAVARKLAVLLHHLWRTQEPYVPLRSVTAA